VLTESAPPIFRFQLRLVARPMTVRCSACSNWSPSIAAGSRSIGCSRKKVKFENSASFERIA